MTTISNETEVPQNAEILSDVSLVENSLKGDTSSFELLVSRYQTSLMKFLRVRCRTESEIEDIFQETFINAYRYLESYKTRYAFSTWLFNIAVNNLKRHARMNPESQSIEDSDSIESNHWRSGSHLDSLSESNIWHIAKTNLTSEHVELLWFTYVQGFTGQQVSKIMERSLPWVKINLIRSKEKLKQSLESQGVSLELLAES